MHVFVVFVVAEMAVFLFSLPNLGRVPDFFARFSVASLFAQLTALSLVLFLCKTREGFNRLPIHLGVAVYALVLVVLAWLWAQLALWLEGNLHTGFGPDPQDRFWFVVRVVIVTWLSGMALLRYFFVQRQWRRKTRQHAQARFLALQSRIKPHFLFNSLNSIASLIAIDPLKAEKAVENLAGLFRHALTDSTDHRVGLRQELEWVNQYLAMEKMRLGDRLQWQLDIDDAALRARLPALCLQPLVENAVMHGIQRSPNGGKIHIQAHIQDQQLVIEIHNPTAPSGQSAPAVGRHHGMALANIRERLGLLYGGKAWMTVSDEGQQFVVRLVLPLELS